VVLGYFFHMSEGELDYAIDAGEMDQRLATIAASKYPLVMHRNGARDHLPVPHAYAPEPDLPLLVRAADSSGYFTLKQDPDGIVRWMPLMIQAGEEYFPPLSILAAWHYLGEPQLMVRAGRYGIEGIQVGDRLVPTDEAAGCSSTTPALRTPSRTSRSPTCSAARSLRHLSRPDRLVPPPRGCTTCGARRSARSSPASRSMRPSSTTS
jgi:hypothetical protein